MTKNSVNNSASDLNCFYRSYTLEFGMENFLAHGMKQVLYLFQKKKKKKKKKKKGDDLSDGDNYRGISLINNGIKLISKIVSKRISEYGLKK